MVSAMFPYVVSQVDGEEPYVSSLVSFVEANREIADEIVDDILPTLARGEVYCGGGAGGEFTVRLARPDELRELRDTLAGDSIDGDEPDWPDISEMVAAIEAAVVPLERLGNLSIHMIQTAPLSTLADLDAQRRAALARCQELLARITAMQEATDAN